MKKNSLIVILFLLSTSISFSQIPIKNYREDIENLKTEKQINEYWNNLYRIDQEILVNTTHLKIADSISISNMIKTVLIFNIHGTKGYNSNSFSGFLPIINLSHNQIGKSQIAYWPIIEKCKEIGGAINSFGGKYPAYQLENVSLTFYNYSLFNQEFKYQKLLNKLSQIKKGNIIDDLNNSFQHQNRLRELKEVTILNSWYLQSFKSQKDEGIFSIVIMSDANLYIKKYGRIQKLELIENKGKTKIYRIENAPFDWNYLYENDGNLTLIDEDQNELMKYTLAE